MVKISCLKFIHLATSLILLGSLLGCGVNVPVPPPPIATEAASPSRPSPSLTPSALSASQTAAAPTFTPTGPAEVLPTLTPPALPDYGVLVARLGKGKVLGMAYAPDGKTFAVATLTAITFYDVSSLEELRSLDVDAHGVSDLRGLFYRSDGSLLAITEEAAQISFWMVKESGLELYASLPGGENRKFQVSTNGQYITLYDSDANRAVSEQVNVWEIEGLRLAASSGNAFFDVEFRIASSPDTTRLAVMNSFAGILDIYNLQGAQYAHSAALALRDMIPDYDHDSFPDYDTLGYDGMQVAVALSPDGRLAAVGGPDHVVRVFSLDEPASAPVILEEQAPDPHKAVQELAFSPDGRALIVMQGSDVYLYQANNWKMVARQKGAAGQVTFSPDGAEMAIASGDKIQFSSTTSGIRRGQIGGFAGNLRRGSLSADGQWLAVGGSSAIYLWDLAQRQLNRVISTGENQALDLAFSPDGQRLAMTMNRRGSSQDCYWGSIWDLSNDSEAAALRSGESSCGRMGRVAYSPDGQWIALGSAEWVELWHESEGEFTLADYAPMISPLGGWQEMAFTPDSGALLYQYAPDQIAAYRMQSDALELIDVSQARALGVADPQTAGWNALIGWVAFSVDGGGAVIAGRAGQLYRQAELAQPPDNLAADDLVFSPDMHWVAGINTRYSGVLVWDARSGAFLGNIPAAAKISLVGGSFLFLPDSQHIVMIEAGGMVSIWKIAP